MELTIVLNVRYSEDGAGLYGVTISDERGETVIDPWDIDSSGYTLDDFVESSVDYHNKEMKLAAEE